jgi:rod shape-determining protein MreB
MAAKKRKQMSDDILHIGIDLGTSRSAVSASNGKREWVESYVGWPKDFVSRKLLGEDIIFGEEVLQNRLSLEVVRPLESGVIRNGAPRHEEAVRELIHHLIELTAPKEGQKIYAAVGVPAEALKINKMAIRNATREYADSLMVVSEPFAIAYGQDTLNHAMIIDIGAGTVDFCIMHGTLPGEEDQRTLTSGGDSIDRLLYERLTEKLPHAKLSEPLIRRFKENNAFVGSNSRKVPMDLAVSGRMVEFDLTRDLRESCESILPPIVETVADLISRYEPEFQEEVRRNVYLAGGGSQIDGIDKALEDGLREFGTFRITTVDDPLFAGADGALALARDMPEEYWEDM